MKPKTEIIPAAAAAELQAEQSAYDQMLTQLRERPAGDTAFHNEALAFAKDETKRLKAKKDVVGRPLREALKGLDSYFSPGLKKLTQLEAIARDKLGEHKTAQLRLQAEASRAAQEAAAAGRVEEAVQAIQRVPVDEPKPDGLTYTYYWVIKSVDPDKLPAEWWMPDTPALEGHCQEHRTADEIPPIEGVVFERIARPIQRGVKES